MSSKCGNCRLVRGRGKGEGMITETIKRFIEGSDYAFVASADRGGSPHLAAGQGLRVPDPSHLVFEAWFCHTTIQNLEGNPAVAIAVADPASGNGYQFVGRIDMSEAAAVLDGYAPDVEPPGMPQVQWRLHVRVEKIMAFSAGRHTDRPL